MGLARLGTKWRLRGSSRVLHRSGTATACIHNSFRNAALWKPSDGTLISRVFASGTSIRHFSDDLDSLFEQNIAKTKSPRDVRTKKPSGSKQEGTQSGDLGLLDLQRTEAKPAEKAAEAVVQSEPAVVQKLLPAFGSDEELIQHVTSLVKETPWRKLYKKLALLGDQVKAHHVPEIMKRARDSPVVFSFYMWVRARRHIQLDPSNLKLLFEILSPTEKAEEMHWLLLEMHKRNMQLDDAMFVTVILAYRKLKRPDDALKLFLKMDSMGCKPPKTSTFNCILRFLLEEGKNLQFDLVHARMKMVRKMNALTYEIVMNKICKFSTAEAAYKFFGEMKASGHEASVAVYVPLIDSLSKAGMETTAFELVDEMKNPSAEVYNQLVLNLVQRGQLSSALTQYKKMLEARLKPYPSTCIPLLTELVVTDRATQACTLFKEMVRARYMKQEDVVPVIQKAYEVCKVEMVWNFVKELPLIGCDFDAATMHALIRGLVEQDRVELARKLFRSFLDSGKKPSVETYNLFVARLKTPEAGKQIIDLMRQNGCELNLQTYNFMMATLVKANMLTDAYNLFLEMTDREYKANAKTYKLLVQILGRKEKITTSAVFEALTRLRDKGHFEGAGIFLKKLAEQNLVPQEEQGGTEGKILIKVMQSDGKRLDDIYM